MSHTVVFINGPYAGQTREMQGEVAAPMIRCYSPTRLLTAMLEEADPEMQLQVSEIVYVRQGARDSAGRTRYAVQ